VTCDFAFPLRKEQAGREKDASPPIDTQALGGRKSVDFGCQAPACPLPKTRIQPLWAGLEGLFKKARQLLKKLAEKLYGCSKNAANTVHASHISVQRVKKSRQPLSLLCQKTVQFAGKPLALVKRSIQRAKNRGCPSSLDLCKTHIAGLSRLSKISSDFHTRFSHLSSVSRKNGQSFKKIFGFSKQRSIGVRVVRHPNYQ
jgi:hypothetical protein